MAHPDHYGKRRGEDGSDLPDFMRPKDVLALPRRPVDLDKFDAELGTAAREVNAYRPPEEEIAAMVLALTYGEMIALVAAINAVADGKLDGIDLAPILYAWGHKTRTA